MNILGINEASAAWIALIISVIGTIASPIITALITNRHQVKLRRQDIQQRAYESYCQSRQETIANFLRQVSHHIFTKGDDRTIHLTDYHCVYQYVPADSWDNLDLLYDAITSYKWDKAKSIYPSIARQLGEILKEEPPEHP